MIIQTEDDNTDLYAFEDQSAVNVAKQLCLNCREKSSRFGLSPWEFEKKALSFSLLEKNCAFYDRFHEKSMFLNLTHCFILTFSQWNLINLGVEVHL